MTATSLFDDFRKGASLWHAWANKARLDIVLRYRRTLLGPVWMVVTTGVLVACLALIAPAIFGHGDPNFIPYLTVGIITWNFIALSVTELGNTFLEHRNEIHSVRTPFSIYVFRIVLRNIIVYMHLMILYLIMALFYGLWVPHFYPIWILSLVLVSVNMVWMGILLGILVARYRDIQQVIASIITIGFLLTPVFWDKAALIGAREWIVKANPLAHALEVLRAPLLGMMPDMFSVYFMIASALVGMISAAMMYRRNINKMVFWL